jgi:hypothetical protein
MSCGAMKPPKVKVVSIPHRPDGVVRFGTTQLAEPALGRGQPLHRIRERRRIRFDLVGRQSIRQGDEDALPRLQKFLPGRASGCVRGQFGPPGNGRLTRGNLRGPPHDRRPVAIDSQAKALRGLPIRHHALIQARELMLVFGSDVAPDMGVDEGASVGVVRHRHFGDGTWRRLGLRSPSFSRVDLSRVDQATAVELPVVAEKDLKRFIQPIHGHDQGLAMRAQQCLQRECPAFVRHLHDIGHGDGRDAAGQEFLSKTDGLRSHQRARLARHADPCIKLFKLAAPVREIGGYGLQLLLKALFGACER